MLLMFALVVVVLVPVLFYLKSYKHRYDISLKIPGPPAWPFIGYTKFISDDPVELFKQIMGLQREYGSLYKTWILTEFWAITSDPVIVEKVLNNQQFLKSKDYEMLKPWLGTGLITSEGKKWFSRRKAITPAFHFKILEDFVKIFEKHTIMLMEKFRTDEIVNVCMPLHLFALDNICETAMGIEINALNDIDSMYVKAVRNVADICYERMFNPFLGNETLFKLTKTSKVFNESLEIVHNMTQSVIEKRREWLSEKLDNKIEGGETDELGRKKKMALLDVLLQITIDGEPLSDSDIKEEVNTFMFAGHDTTGTACGFLLYNIAKYPEIQEKLVIEIGEIIGKDRNAEVTMVMLNELRYLDLVVKESLRYHTTVPLIARQILKETIINDYLLPADTNMSLNVYGMCHCGKLFPNPEQFIPERFESVRSAEDVNPYTYIPFSAGPRNCIGQKFALLEIKMLAVKVLQNYVVCLARPDEELVLGVGITLQAVNGIKLRFTERLEAGQ